MALTIAKLSPDPSHVSGNVKVRYRKITFDASYPTGGEALTAANFGLSQLYTVEICGGVAMKSDETLAFPIGYDETAKKLVAFEGDNDNAADAPLIEQDNTESLDTYYVTVKGIGI